jgi:hypothetical protein
VETFHAEGDSPFAVKEDNASDSAGTAEDPPYAECPVDGCGELLLLQELDYHLELHAQESGESGDRPQDEAFAPAPEREAPTAPSPSGLSRARRESERQGRSDHGSEKEDRQAKAISAWKRLFKMPSSSSAHRLLPKRRHHDESKTGATHSTRGKRLGVSLPACH